MIDIAVGNANDRVASEPEHRGWILGHFMPDGDPLQQRDVEVKWIHRNKGVVKKGEKTSYPGHTFVLLIEGKLQLTFPTNQQTYVLEKRGDYIYYNAQQDSHESESLEDTTAICIRWPSQPEEV